ncbi:MAG: DUF4230 domain-containing protein, partial [Muribaculaceae bacterium]|nr:DUF4230 domain-containing protein [Muribaculaceae bacterium]
SHRLDTAEAVYSELRSVDKLTLASMSISKMATVEDIAFDEASGLRQTADAVLASLKIGDRVAAYSYNTYLIAYIDMSALRADDIHVDKSRHSITVELPPIHTEFAGRDPGMREDHYRVTGLRSSINADERARIKERMNTRLKTEVESSDTFRNILVERAEAKARRYFESLLAADGYIVHVNFKNK